MQHANQPTDPSSSRSIPTTSRFIDRDSELECIRQLLDRLQRRHRTTFEGVSFYGIPGIGKTRLSRRIAEMCHERKIPVALIDFAQNTCISPNDYRSVVYRELAGVSDVVPVLTLDELCTRLTQALQGRSFVLVHDNCDCCDPNLFDWIGREFLMHMTQQYQRPLVFLAAGRGEYVPLSNWPPELSSKVKSRYLKPFDRKATRKHIEAVDKSGRWEQSAEELYAISRGHPLSTEMLLFYLQTLQVDASELPRRRKTLAGRLYKELLRQKVLPKNTLWPHRNFLITSFPRRFDAGLLAELEKEHSFQWYNERMRQCMGHPLHLIRVESANPQYSLDLLLRRIMQAVVAILWPDRAKHYHQQLCKIFKSKFQDDPLRSSVGVWALVEYLYHMLQGLLLDGVQSATQIQNALDQLLRDALDSPDARKVEEFADLLLHDAEFSELLGRKTIKTLAERVRDFVQRLQPGVVCFVHVDFTPPSQYSWSWETMPTAPVRRSYRWHSSMQFSLSEWRQDPLATGKLAYSSYVPEELQHFLRKRSKHAILLSTNTMHIPFELFHDDNDFLCLSRPFARQIETALPVQQVEPIPPRPLRALVVGDPSEDLDDARIEAGKVADFLQKQGVEVKLLLQEQAALKTVVRAIHEEKFHFIHFACHGYFDANNPRMSGLVLNPGDGQSKILHAEEVRRYLRYPAFIYFNVCEAASASPKTTKTEPHGVLIENLAIYALTAGACGCLAPMWEIRDSDARRFAYHFYKNLLDGQTTGEAVRSARLVLKEKAVTSDIWMCWALFGNPNARPLANFVRAA